MSRIIGKPGGLEGKVFDKLTVIKEVVDSHPARHWLCRCECGEERMVQGGYLRNGRVHHCGKCVKPSGRKPDHGMSHSTEYKIWDGMTQRCTNKNAPDYPEYGGRGIKICERWSTFKNFYEDMGARPTGMSIDRKDNNGDYCPDNCEWSTAVKQQRNKRNNRLLTFNNITATVSEWSERTGISRTVLFNRLWAKWSIEDTLTKPVRTYPEKGNE